MLVGYLSRADGFLVVFQNVHVCSEIVSLGLEYFFRSVYVLCIHFVYTVRCGFQEWLRIDKKSMFFALVSESRFVFQKSLVRP